MKKRVLGLMLAGLTGAVVLAGCAGSGGVSVDKDAVLKPGTYTGQSSESDDEDGGGYAVVKLTIGENNEVENVDFETFESNGESKHSDSYGMINGKVSNQDYYDKAQAAIAACDEYVQQYMETKDLDQIDAVSGATISYNQFKEAVSIALQKAAE